MAGFYPTSGAFAPAHTLAFNFDSPPPADKPAPRLSRQERNRRTVSRHIDKDPAAYRAKCRERDNAKYAADPLYRQAKQQRHCVNYFAGAIKKGKTPGYAIRLGYSGKAFKAHIEAQFQPGMTWDNYGESWNLDHIKPVIVFLREGETRHHTISALDNLRPCWKEENNSKHDRDAPTEPTYTKEREEYTGERHHFAKMTAAKAREVKARLRSPRFGLVAELAREFGVSRNTIEQIKSGKSWKDA